MRRVSRAATGASTSSRAISTRGQRGESPPGSPGTKPRNTGKEASETLSRLRRPSQELVASRPGEKGGEHEAFLRRACRLGGGVRARSCRGPRGASSRERRRQRNY